MRSTLNKYNLLKIQVIALLISMFALACVPQKADMAPGFLTVSVEQKGVVTRNLIRWWLRRREMAGAGGGQESLMIFNGITSQWVPWLATGFTGPPTTGP